MRGVAVKKVLVILRKEWLELRQDARLMIGATAPVLIFTLLPIIGVYIVGRIPLRDSDIQDLARFISANSALAGLNATELAQANIGVQFSTFFVLLPIITPSVLASYSIVGEKTNRTLEPLLATPVRTWELLLGKILAALIPAVALTWVAGGIFIAGIALLATSRRVFTAIVSPAWLLILLVITPLLSLIVIAALVAVSSRVNDPRTAQQVSAFLVIPFILIFVGQIAGLVVLGPALVLAASVVLALIAALALWGVTRLFQREMILTRWK
jgi:ABC-2 type transport system permease protein